MASLINNGLLQSRVPILQFKRFRGKINIQKPRQPHYERALVNAVTAPKYNLPTVTEQCRMERAEKSLLMKTKREANQYEKIIARECLNWFNHSKMICFYQLNSIKAEELFEVRVAFHKKNMRVSSWGGAIMREAITGSKYENVLPLFASSKTCIVFSPETNFRDTIQIVKKCPQMILLSAIIEDRLLNSKQLEYYATLPDIQTLRSETVSILQSIGGQLVTSLNSHQYQLARLLELRAKSLEAVGISSSKDIEPNTNNPDDLSKKEDP